MSQVIQNKIAEIDKKIEMLSEVINKGLGQGITYAKKTTGYGTPQTVKSDATKEIEAKYKAQLSAYKTSYGGSTPIIAVIYNNWNTMSESTRNYLLKNFSDQSMWYLMESKRGQINIQKELNNLIQERTNQESFLQNQLIKQADSKTKQEEEKIRLLQEQLAANKQKTEQERQKALQELQKAKQEAEKAKLAADLARQGGAGNIAAGKTLLGTWESKVGTSPWIIAGISVGALISGVIVFKILK